MSDLYKTMNAFTDGLCTRRSFLGSVAAGGLAAGIASTVGLGLANPERAYAAEAANATDAADAANAANAASTSTLPGNEAPSAIAPLLTPGTRTRALAPYASPSVIPDEERLQNTKRVLIVVDYQVDFVDGGVFGTIEPAIALEDAICDVINEYRENDDIIIYTMDTHPADHYDETREGTFNPPHCITGSDGWQIYGKVRDLLTPENAIRVLKGTYGSRDLPTVLQAIQSQGITIEMIEFAGVSTTCRVLHNAIIVYNFFPEIPLVFDERTTASYTDEATAEQLATLEGWGFIVKHA